MKAYINDDNLVVSIGENDSLFPNCTPIEITAEEKLFIERCSTPKRINNEFIDAYIEVIEVPREISKMALSLRLLERNISDQDIFDDIDSIPDSMFPPLEKAKAKVKYITARTFERHDADLNLVATMEGLSQDDVDQIFIGN
jgi:hypothetical protein